MKMAQKAHVVMKPYKGSKACEQVYPSGLHYHHPTTFVGVPAAIAMTAAVPSTSASLLPASAARPLAGSTGEPPRPTPVARVKDLLFGQSYRFQWSTKFFSFLL